MSRLHTTNLGSLVSVNGIQVPKGCSTLSITYQDTSDSDSGRSSLTGSMWKGYIGTLRTLKCAWNSLYPDHIREILQAVKGLNRFPVRFFDPESGEYVTSDFYVGDRSTDIKTFFRNHELIGLNLTLIENDPYADGNGDTGGGGGGIVPEGTIRLTSNGEHDVTEYATANVQVPPYGQGEITISSNGRHNVSGKATAIVDVDAGGITPTGTIEINSNGKRDVTAYAEADVNVPPYGEGEIEINDNGRINVSGKATAVVNVPTGINPTGTVKIDSNGQHDVTDYAEADVQVPPYGVGTVEIASNGEHDVSGKAKAIVNVPTGGITPSGTLDITANGNYDVTQYAQAHVQVDGGGSGGGGDDPSDYDPEAVYAATRPADWLPMPTPEAGEMFILMLIPNGGSSYIAMLPTTNSGQYTVELGTMVDGAFAATSDPEAVDSGTKWEAELQASAWGDPTADGYRQCMIRVSGDIQTWQPTSHSDLYGSTTYAYAIAEIACNLPGCRTVKVANISQMRYFAWYGSNAATSNYLESMFDGCTSLVAILALDTRHATSVYRMCYQCHSLRAIPALDLGVHEDRQTVGANNMMQDCYALTGIPNMDMSAVVELSYAFKECYALRSLPRLDIAQCTNISSMLQNCVSLTSITGINMPAATIASYMCDQCTVLQTVGNIVLPACTNMYYMFSGCSALQTVGDIVSPVCTNMSYIFAGCSSLRSVSKLDASGCTKLEYAFQNCYALESLPNIAPTVSCSGRALCYNCYSLRSVDNVDFSHFSSLRDAFRGCAALQRMPDMHLDLCTDVQYMFSGCTSLIAIERMRMAKVSSVSSLFASCRALASIRLDPDIEGWSGAAITIPQSSLSHDAVVALIDSLPTITSARTLSITSSPAADTLTEDELAVATAKNWTVTVT